MLGTLRITNVAIIDEIELEFGPRLNVLTGETGAGKTVIMSALGMILGAKGFQDLVRTGADEATVEAFFDAPNQGARGILEEGGYGGGGEVVVQRALSASGRSRARVNGKLSTSEFLTRLGRHLVQIYGQHEHQILLQPENHLGLLDQSAGLREMVDAMKQSFLRMAAARSRLEEAKKRQLESRERSELLDFQSKEISSMKLDPEEETALTDRRLVLQNMEKLFALAKEGEELLYSGENAIVGNLERYLMKWNSLFKLTSELESVHEGLLASLAQLRDCASSFGSFAGRTPFDPQELERVEERLFQIQKLKKKYGATVGEILAYRDKIEVERAERETIEGLVLDLEQSFAEAAQSAEKCAENLTLERKKQAGRFKREIEAELAELGMKGSRFDVLFDEGEKRVTESGCDRLEFYLSPNAGEDLRPLAKIASGGELSRIMLAIKSLTRDRGEVDTLIFDEVDVGIGGKVAEIVGRKLKEVASRHQVFCITHLPQIAAFADQHFQIRKEIRDGRSVSVARPLEGADRVEELARMLAGVEITERARKHAEELLSKKTGLKETASRHVR